MKYPKILVTGATGRTGSAVVDELLAKGVPVRALVHSKDARSAALERKGAETVVADMFDLDQLLAAMHGTQRAYYLPFYDPHLIQSAATFAIAAQQANLEAGVTVGQWLASPVHPSPTTRQAWLPTQVSASLPGLAVGGAVAWQYIWPALRERPSPENLKPILLLHGFRFLGLAFVAPGVVSPELPAAFAQPVAYGDLISAILALLALATLGTRSGTMVTWVFNTVGTADLLFAFYQGGRISLPDTQG